MILSAEFSLFCSLSFVAIKLEGKLIKVYVVGRKGDKYFWYSYVKWLNIKIFINILNNFYGFFKIVIVNINV